MLIERNRVMPKAAVKSRVQKRASPRKEVEPLRVSNLTSLENFVRIARYGEVIEASANGLLLMVKRDDLVPTSLRGGLNIDALVGDKVFIHLEDMNLEISGTIKRTEFKGKKGFLIAVDYSSDAPEYWRECLMDLLPTPGELDQ